MASKAYQKIPQQYAPPSAGVAGSGLQQAADGSVVGFDANVFPNRFYQRIGGAPVSAGYVVYDGTIP